MIEISFALPMISLEFRIVKPRNQVVNSSSNAKPET